MGFGNMTHCAEVKIGYWMYCFGRKKYPIVYT